MRDKMEKLKKGLNNNSPIAILGNCHTGKTNLSIFLAFNCGYKTKYILGYPKEVKGFKRLSDLKDLSKISNCVVVIDELDEIVPMLDRRANESIKRVLKFTAHNNIKLIFNTQLSQFVSKMMSALVPCWAFTEIDVFGLKNGSKPKRILIDYIKVPHIVNKEIGMRLKLGKFIWYNEYGNAGENGVYKFPDMKIGKAWKNDNKNAKKTDIKTIKKSDKNKTKNNLKSQKIM